MSTELITMQNSNCNQITKEPITSSKNFIPFRIHLRNMQKTCFFLSLRLSFTIFYRRSLQNLKIPTLFGSHKPASNL